MSTHLQAAWHERIEAARGDLVLYHGTHADRVEGLKADGLQQPGNLKGSADWPQLTTSFPQAQRYSRDGTVAEYHIPKSKVWQRGRSDALLWPGREHDVYNAHDAIAYAVKEPVTSEYLHKVHGPGGEVKTATYHETGQWSPPPDKLSNGDRVSTWGDAVPGGYNESLRSFHPETGEETGRFETQTARGDPVHQVAWMHVPDAHRGRGTLTQLRDHYRDHILSPGESLDYGGQTDEGAEWVKKHG